MIDFFLFIIAKLFILFLSFIPLNAALWIGRRFGDIIYLVNVKRRSIAYSNLKSCFPEKSAGELKRIVKIHYRNLAMSIIEVLKLPSMKRSYSKKHIKTMHFERLQKAFNNKKGVIILTAHFGNWEASSIIMAEAGYKMTVFARQQKYHRLDNLLNKHRAALGCKVVTKGFSIRDIIKELNKGGIVAMLFDQDAGSNGVFVDLFNRPSSTATGPIMFSRKTGALIVPSFTRRVGYSDHVVEMEEPLTLIDTGDKEKDLKVNLERVSKILEQYITKFPEQWLWSHKRWKSSPERRILILSDSKAGHLNQAKAVATYVKDALGKRLKERGIEEGPIVKTKVVGIGFRNPFMRFLLEVSSMFASRRCQGCMRCLRFCLDEKSFNELKNEYADIIISCGAGTVATNVFLKYENNAKNCVIMKPGLGRSHRFNLVILPRHDKPAMVRSNMLITELAPTQVTCHKTQDTLLRQGYGGQASNGIGILIGGDAKGFKLEIESVKNIAGGVLRLAEEKGLDLLVTTSRRTSKDIEKYLKERLKDNKNCKLLVIANEKNPEGTIQNIFEKSEVLIVSSESISMISEAISSGRYVVVFRTQDTGHRSQVTDCKNKYGKFITDLEERGYIRVVEPKDIHNTVNELLANRPEIKKIEDKYKIVERLKNLL
ncbi:MAG: ELM1/GtrOC1 family putative glycosyltransferase [Candidatus Omnitrophota bacterium]